jgi:hypothetical protein
VVGDSAIATTARKINFMLVLRAEGVQKYQFTRIAPSGTNQRIEFITALNPDCTSSGDVNVRITPNRNTVKSR